ncbi:DUF5979 domain-containing protein [Aeromicrobium sp. UC242_57]|uniref:DUF5979 domain-containing protein n=1 Tax=Aeromicrobium sp. UC242_57 TaxID=3374624 RepID=UPI0037BA54B6
MFRKIAQQGRRAPAPRPDRGHQGRDRPGVAVRPDTFKADVICTAGEVELDLGDDATIELTSDNDYTVRIPGIPVSQDGTSCTITEQGETGEFGETSRDGSPVTLQVTDLTDVSEDADDEEIVESQTATITNDYQFTGLSVTKKVDTQAGGAEFGPFTFSVKCESALGDPGAVHRGRRHADVHSRGRGDVDCSGRPNPGGRLVRRHRDRPLLRRSHRRDG